MFFFQVQLFASPNHFSNSEIQMRRFFTNFFVPLPVFFFDKLENSRKVFDIDHIGTQQTKCILHNNGIRYHDEVLALELNLVLKQVSWEDNQVNIRSQCFAKARPTKSLFDLHKIFLFFRQSMSHRISILKGQPSSKFVFVSQIFFGRAKEQNDVVVIREKSQTEETMCNFETQIQFF